MIRWLASILLLLPIWAHAQSVPNGGAITPGQVWTPEQWMNAWQSKLDTTNGTLNNPTLNGGTSINGTFNNPVLNGPTSTNGTFNNPTINGGSVTVDSLTGNASFATATATGTSSSRTFADRFAQTINILDVGAHNDGVSYADGTISASSATFTSNKTTFTSADVGKPIYVDGIGPNGTPLITTISGFNTSHSITLAQTASTSSANSFATSAVVVTAQSGGGSYAPGDTVTLTGGTAVQQPVLTVLTTKLVSASVNAGGSGGTNGACILSGTTGTGRVFRVNATISGGAVTAIGSIVDPGSYSTNPSNLVAEPVTGCSLTGSTITLKVGYSTGYVTIPGSYSAVPSNPVSQGSTSGSGTGATFTLQTQPSGTYVYGTDNTQAIGTAVARVNALFATGVHACIYFPSYDPRSGSAGAYFVSSQPTQFALNVPGCVFGDGPQKTIFALNASFNGGLFSTDDAWKGLNTPFGGSQPFSATQLGAYFKDFTVQGDTLAAGEQDAITFFDHTDWAVVENITCLNIHGMCIAGGPIKTDPTSWIEESTFRNIVSWSAGTATNPAILITGIGGDAANENKFFGFDLLRCYTKCLVVSDNDASDIAGGTRLNRFFSPRIERSMNGDDLVLLGDPTLPGIVSQTEMYGLDIEQTQTDHVGIRVTSSAPGTYRPYAIDLYGTIVGVGYGLQIDAGKSINFRGTVSTTQTGIIVGPGIGNTVSFDIIGGPGSTTWSIDPTIVSLVQRSFQTTGDPTQVGAGAVNLQASQTNNSLNTASGTNSVAIGDGTAMASATEAIAIGHGVTAAGTNSTAIGTGPSLLAAGVRSFVTGASACGDHGDIGHWVWCAITLNSAQDNGVGMFILNGRTTSNTPQTLATNANPIATASNIANPPFNSVYFGHVECAAISPAGDLAIWNDGTNGTVLQKGASNASTALRVGTLSSIYASTGAASWSLSEAADTTNGGLQLTATGAAATTIDWACKFSTIELL